MNIRSIFGVRSCQVLKDKTYSGRKNIEENNKNKEEGEVLMKLMKVIVNIENEAIKVLIGVTTSIKNKTMKIRTINYIAFNSKETNNLVKIIQEIN